MSKHLANDIVNKPLKILIVGLGWLGKELALYLSKSGHKVCGTVRTESKLMELLSDGIITRLYELPNSEKLDFPFSESFDVAVVAIPPGIRGGKPLNQIGFESLSKSLRRLSIPNMILISSTGIYPSSMEIITESSGIVSDSGLKLMEDCFSNWADSLTIIRFAGLIGPGRHPSKFYKGDKKIPNPDAEVNFIHQDDCVNLIETIIKKEFYGAVINGVIPHHPKRKAFYEMAFDLAGRSHPSFELETTEFKTVDSEIVSEKLQYQFIHPDLFELLKKMKEQ